MCILPIPWGKNDSGENKTQEKKFIRGERTGSSQGETKERKPNGGMHI